MVTAASSSSKKVVVIGATGATGKYVVQMLLDNGGYNVVAVARSKEKMLSLLDQKDYGDKLVVQEASLMDLSTTELKDLTDGCIAVVSCLGHNMTLQGMYRDGKIVTGATKALTSAMPKDCRFILMASNGVENPDKVSDPIRPFSERLLLFVIRWLVPPHSDNEQAALYLHQHRTEFDWSVVRPPNLVDGDVSEYDVFECQTGASLFGDGVATRANVAHFMVRLVVDPETWSKYKHKMPVIYDKSLPETAPQNETEGG